jgi:hypothetical protein
MCLVWFFYYFCAGSGLVEFTLASGYMLCWLVSVRAKGQTFQKALRPSLKELSRMVAASRKDNSSGRHTKFALCDCQCLISAGC